LPALGKGFHSWLTSAKPLCEVYAHGFHPEYRNHIFEAKGAGTHQTHRDADDKLSANKLALAQNVMNIQAGLDNRWTILHPVRFLLGVASLATKKWLTSREVISLIGHPPVGNYAGLRGFVTGNRWVELHNPSSSKLV
jgi:hypothetical protein